MSVDPKPPTVGLETLVRGFNQARNRLAPATDAAEFEHAYMAVFEALNWAAAIDEFCKYPDSQLLRGLHYVRNTVHHQLAQAIDFELPRAYGEGAYGSGVYGGVAYWSWKPLHDLPPLPPDRENKYTPAKRKGYEDVVAGHNVRPTLDALSNLFDTLSPKASSSSDAV